MSHFTKSSRFGVSSHSWSNSILSPFTTAYSLVSSLTSTLIIVLSFLSLENLRAIFMDFRLFSPVQRKLLNLHQILSLNQLERLGCNSAEMPLSKS